MNNISNYNVKFSWDIHKAAAAATSKFVITEVSYRISTNKFSPM